MALRVSASTDRIGAGSGSTLDNLDVGTSLMWVLVDSAVGFFYDKSTGTTNRMCLDFSGGSIRFRRDRAGSDLVIPATATDFAAYGTGKWILVAVVWDINTSVADQKLYVGDLTTPAAEPSAYGVGLAFGSGAGVDNAAANLTIGNNQGFANPLGAGADIGMVAFFNVKLTLEQIIEWQFNPANKPNCVLLHEYWGTGTQGDQSGNGNDGTVTGATATSHPGFALRSGGGYQGNVTVAAAGGAIAGTSAGAATATGTLRGRGALAGASAGVATVSGTLRADGALAGATAGVATVVGTLHDAASTGMVGTSAGVATVTGTLRATGTLSGSSAGVGAASGTLRGIGDLAGSTAGVATVTGTLRGRGYLVGLSAGVATATGTLSADALMAGTSAGVAAVTGTLRDAAAIDWVIQMIDTSVPAYDCLDSSVPAYRLTDWSAAP